MVDADMAAVGIIPADFYAGQGNNWSAIAGNLDIKRRITEDILINILLQQAGDQDSRVFLLKGHAGSGKSVTLKRFAWELSQKLNQLVIYVPAEGRLTRDVARELYDLTKQRVTYVFDDAMRRSTDIAAVSKAARTEKLPVTVVMAARTNEWNIGSGELESLVDNEYELRDLNPSEVSELLAKLEEHDCLGHLKDVPDEKRREFFVLTAEYQLLVALHEATMGRPFEDIVLDEFRNVRPEGAKALYLDVCTLHRFDVGLRAGLLSRISGISIERFEKDFFKPLEHLVSTYFDSSSRDYAYRSRHPVIADVIFKNLFETQADRATQIERVISFMNVDYESDSRAFEQMIRGKHLATLFSDRQFADRIFSAAMDSSANLSHVEHQRAVFELNHVAGNLDAALSAIERALSAGSGSQFSILHTKALVLRKKALNASEGLGKDAFRQEARRILERQAKTSHTSHALHSIGQLLIDELREALIKVEDPNSALVDRAVASLSKQLEKVVSDGHSKFPADSHMLTLEASFAQLLEQEPRFITALENAFAHSPGDGLIAVRLAKAQVKAGVPADALSTLAQCIERNPADKRARYEYARQLIRTKQPDNKAVIRHLRASFSEGDTNYAAQFWCARHYFLYDDRSRAKELFQKLEKARVPPAVRNRVQGFARNYSGELESFVGHISRLEDGFCFIQLETIQESVFAHYTQFSGDQWGKLRVGNEVSCYLGFSFRGPVATEVRAN
ncbi:cold shock domain-containing protein [Salinisphaera sp. T5B8]|uniref:P-loop NTPase n=1 Tax=Salinisphaera sp. T5B8 TaxID=1304154 RepID=UPI0033420AA6